MKGYKSLSFAESMGKYKGKSIWKNVSSKYSNKPPDHAKQSAADAIKTASKRTIQQQQLVI